MVWFDFWSGKLKGLKYAAAKTIARVFFEFSALRMNPQTLINSFKTEHFNQKSTNKSYN